MGVTFNTTIQLNDTEFRFEKLKVARMVMGHSYTGGSSACWLSNTGNSVYS